MRSAARCRRRRRPARSSTSPATTRSTTPPSGGKGPGVLIEAMIGGLGALIVLAFVFASFIAIVPIVMAIFAIVATFMLMWGADDVRERLVHRPVPRRADRPRRLHRLHAARRPALARGARAAARRTSARSSWRWRRPARSVVFSGTTVGIGLLALVVLPVPFLRSIGYAGMLIPLVSVLVSITLLPVILATIGPWIDRPRIRTERDASRFWTRWSTGVVRRRWWAAAHRDGDPARARDPGDAASRSATRAPSRWRRAATRAQGLDALDELRDRLGRADRVPRARRATRARAGEVAGKLAAVSGVRGAAVALDRQRRGRRRRAAEGPGELERRAAALLAPEGRGAHGAGHDRRRPGRAGRRLRLGRLRQLPADDRADRAC